MFDSYNSDEEREAIKQFCRVVEDAGQFLKKNNRHYPIRKMFFTLKRNLVYYLYKKNYCVQCTEVIQTNPNVKDKTPYIIVKMKFHIDDFEIIFCTPKNVITFDYVVNMDYEMSEVFPQRTVNFEMSQILEINGLLKSIFHLEHYRKRKTFMRRLQDVLDWKASDKLREVNKHIGIFD